MYNSTAWACTCSCRHTCGRRCLLHRAQLHADSGVVIVQAADMGAQGGACERYCSISARCNGIGTADQKKLQMW